NFRLYQNKSGGYILGSTGLPDGKGGTIPVSEITQGFQNTKPYYVNGAMIYFGAKKVSGAAKSKIVIKLYSMNKNKAISQPANPFAVPDAMGPDALIASVDLLLSDADTTKGKATFVKFPIPKLMYTDFAISMNIDNLNTNKDTIGIFGNNRGDGGGLNY